MSVARTPGAQRQPRGRVPGPGPGRRARDTMPRMRIAVDARSLCGERTGVGRTLEGLYGAFTRLFPGGFRRPPVPPPDRPPGRARGPGRGPAPRPASPPRHDLAPDRRGRRGREGGSGPLPRAARHPPPRLSPSGGRDHPRPDPRPLPRVARQEERRRIRTAAPRHREAGRPPRLRFPGDAGRPPPRLPGGGRQGVRRPERPRPLARDGPRGASRPAVRPLHRDPRAPEEPRAARRGDGVDLGPPPGLPRPRDRRAERAGECPASTRGCRAPGTRPGSPASGGSPPSAPPSSSGAPGSSPTRASTRDSASLPSRRWPKGSPSSRPPRRRCRRWSATRASSPTLSTRAPSPRRSNGRTTTRRSASWPAARPGAGGALHLGGRRTRHACPLRRGDGVTRLRVALDARKLRDFGIGTYVRGLLGAAAARGEHELVALVRSGDEVLLPDGRRSDPLRCRRVLPRRARRGAARAFEGRVRRLPRPSLRRAALPAPGHRRDDPRPDPPETSGARDAGEEALRDDDAPARPPRRARRPDRLGGRPQRPRGLRPGARGEGARRPERRGEALSRSRARGRRRPRPPRGRPRRAVRPLSRERQAPQEPRWPPCSVRARRPGRASPPARPRRGSLRTAGGPGRRRPGGRHRGPSRRPRDRPRFRPRPAPGRSLGARDALVPRRLRPSRPRGAGRRNARRLLRPRRAPGGGGRRGAPGEPRRPGRLRETRSSGS